MLHWVFFSSLRTKYLLIFRFLLMLTPCEIFSPVLTGMWVTASLPRYPGHFWVFKLILIILCLPRISKSYFSPLRVFHTRLADGFSLELEWQQVSSSLQNSSQYSGLSQQYCSLDGLHSSYFQVLQSLYQTIGDCTERTNYNWYHSRFHVPQFFFSVLLQGLSTYLSFRFLSVLPSGHSERQSSLFGRFGVSFSFL